MVYYNLPVGVVGVVESYAEHLRLHLEGKVYLGQAAVAEVGADHLNVLDSKDST